MFGLENHVDCENQVKKKKYFIEVDFQNKTVAIAQTDYGINATRIRNEIIGIYDNVSILRIVHHFESR